MLDWCADRKVDQSHSVANRHSSVNRAGSQSGHGVHEVGCFFETNEGSVILQQAKRHHEKHASFDPSVETHLVYPPRPRRIR